MSKKGQPLTTRERRELAQIVAARGEREASANLGVSPHTLARAAAGFPLHGSTAELLALKLSGKV